MVKIEIRRIVTLGHPVFTLCHEQYILSFLYQELVMQELVAQETIKMF